MRALIIIYSFRLLGGEQRGVADEPDLNFRIAPAIIVEEFFFLSLCSVFIDDLRCAVIIDCIEPFFRYFDLN